MRKHGQASVLQALGLVAALAAAGGAGADSTVPFTPGGAADSLRLQWVRILESQGETRLAWSTLQSLETADCDTRQIAFRLLMKQQRFAAARDTLQRHPECFEGAGGNLLEALLALRLDEPSTALAHLDSMGAPGYLGHFAQALRADALARLERWSEARSAAEAALESRLPQEMQRPIRVIEAQACFALGEPERLRALAPRLGEDARSDDRTGLLLVRLARTVLQEGERSQARQWLLDLLDARPAPAESAYVLLQSVQGADSSSVDEELTLARYEDRSGHAERARNRLQNLSERPGLAGEAEAEIWTTLAGFLRRQGRATECLTLLQDKEGRIAGTPAEADLWLLRGRCFRTLGDEPATIESYREMARRFPTDPRADDALYEVAWRYEIGGDFEQAAEIFSSLTRRFPHSRLVDDAFYREGLCEFRRGRFAEALLIFASLESRYPQSPLVPRALYWRAWILERRGDVQEAAALRHTLREEYEDSYFASLADSAAQRDGWRAAQALEDTTPDLDVGSRGYAMAWHHAAVYEGAIATLRQRGVPRPSPRFTETSRFWRFCLDRGLAREAMWETQRLERLFAAEPGALLELLAYCEARGAQENLVRLSYRLSLLVTQPAFAGAIEVLRHPAPYTVTLAGETQKRGLSQAVMLALMRQESAFDPRADSRAGARGLMQLMPAVGKRVAHEQGRPDLASDGLYDPSLNVQLGCQLFSEELERAGGDLPQTLAAYNAGSEPAAIWARRLRPEEPRELYLDVAEYLETRNYLDRVLLGAQTYRRVYGLP